MGVCDIKELLGITVYKQEVKKIDKKWDNNNNKHILIETHAAPHLDP